MLRKRLALVVLSICSNLWALEGGLQTANFTGPVTGKQVHFSIYLPPDYQESGLKYPVVYHLHGLGSSYKGKHPDLVTASFEQARQEGIIEPVIIVFPDAYQNTMWADSHDMAKPAETNLIKEIIPYIDANYRTRTDRRFRIIQGFSMGGYGASMLAVKYPKMFGCCINYNGALHTWQTLLKGRRVIAREIFNNKPTIFDKFSPWHWAEQNKSQLQSESRPPFHCRVVVGALTQFNRKWRDYLAVREIPFEYVETGHGHNLRAILKTEGKKTWTFIAQSMKQQAEKSHSGTL